MGEQLKKTLGFPAAEISAAIPRTGGMMVYSEEIYGNKLSFLTGCKQCYFFQGQLLH